MPKEKGEWNMKIQLKTIWQILFQGLITLLLLNGPLHAADEQDEVWKDLKQDIFAQKKISESPSFMSIDAPYRAHDAALVPITIKADKPGAGVHYKTLTLVIDNNPVPVAARFELSPKLGALHLETRVRIDQYSHVRAIIETNDGKLYMATKYVKASGGCSAPAMKDMDAKMAMLGKSKLRQFTLANQPEKARQSQREIQVMVRHPNYSGMQLNQETGYYIPAHYVKEIVINLDGEQLMKVDGAISLSEDPAIRFRFMAETSEPVISLTVKDTKKQTFDNQWQLKPPAPKGS